MSTDEQRTKKTEYMRKWRAAHPEKSKAIQEAFKESHGPQYWRDWQNAKRRSDPDAARAEEAAYRDANRPLVQRTNNEWRRKWAGVPETDIHKQFSLDHPNAFSIDRVRPDFYIQGEGFFEIKRALPFRRSWFQDTSAHFPGLFFFKGKWSSEGKSLQTRRSLDEQIAAFPRPLTVLIYHAITAEEISRLYFP